MENERSAYLAVGFIILPRSKGLLPAEVRVLDFFIADASSKAGSVFEMGLVGTETVDGIVVAVGADKTVLAAGESENEPGIGAVGEIGRLMDNGTKVGVEKSPGISTADGTEGEDKIVVAGMADTATMEGTDDIATVMVEGADDMAMAGAGADDMVMAGAADETMTLGAVDGELSAVAELEGPARVVVVASMLRVFVMLVSGLLI